MRRSARSLKLLELPVYRWKRSATTSMWRHGLSLSFLFWDGGMPSTPQQEVWEVVLESTVPSGQGIDGDGFEDQFDAEIHFHQATASTRAMTASNQADSSTVWWWLRNINCSHHCITLYHLDGHNAHKAWYGRPATAAFWLIPSWQWRRQAWWLMDTGKEQVNPVYMGRTWGLKDPGGFMAPSNPSHHFYHFCLAGGLEEHSLCLWTWQVFGGCQEERTRPFVAGATLQPLWTHCCNGALVALRIETGETHTHKYSDVLSSVLWVIYSWPILVGTMLRFFKCFHGFNQRGIDSISTHPWMLCGDSMPQHANVMLHPS